MGDTVSNEDWRTELSKEVYDNLATHGLNSEQALVSVSNAALRSIFDDIKISVVARKKVINIINRLRSLRRPRPSGSLWNCDACNVSNSIHELKCHSCKELRLDPPIDLSGTEDQYVICNAETLVSDRSILEQSGFNGRSQEVNCNYVAPSSSENEIASRAGSFVSSLLPGSISIPVPAPEPAFSDASTDLLSMQGVAAGQEPQVVDNDAVCAANISSWVCGRCHARFYADCLYCISCGTAAPPGMPPPPPPPRQQIAQICQELLNLAGLHEHEALNGLNEDLLNSIHLSSLNFEVNDNGDDGDDEPDDEESVAESDLLSGPSAPSPPPPPPPSVASDAGPETGVSSLTCSTAQTRRSGSTRKKNNIFNALQMLRTCARCKHFVFYKARFCPVCGFGLGDNLDDASTASSKSKKKKKKNILTELSKLLGISPNGKGKGKGKKKK